MTDLSSLIFNIRVTDNAEQAVHDATGKAAGLYELPYVISSWPLPS